MECPECGDGFGNAGGLASHRSHRHGVEPPVCRIDGCSRPHEARGFCHLHYQRWRIHGDPHHVGTPGRRVVGADRHGNSSGYITDGCRCGKCRAWWSDYSRRRRERL